MAEFTAAAVQTVAAGGDLLFTDAPISGSCSIVHREGSGIITVRGLTNQCRARFRVRFGSNISVPTGQTVQAISAAIAVDGEALASSTMTVTPAAVDNLFNVSTEALVDVPAGCCSTITIKNVNLIPINFTNSNLIVERVA